MKKGKNHNVLKVILVISVLFAEIAIMWVLMKSVSEYDQASNIEHKAEAYY